MDGRKLKERRLELGLTLEDVGNIVGVGKSTVRKWETGFIENMKRDKIALLAKALKTTPLFIMGLDNQGAGIPDIPSNPGPVFNNSEIIMMSKFKALDEKGKHTVKTVLDMEYSRVRNSQFDVVAAHSDDYSEEQQSLMEEDLAELEKLHARKTKPR